MTSALTHQQTGRDYEFVLDGEIVAHLVWIEQHRAAGSTPGWVLRVPGWPDRQMYRIPQALADDPAAARSYREAAVLGLAHVILDDRLSGLVPKPA